MMVLLIGVLIYLAVYIFRSLTNNVSTTIAYQDTLEVELDTTGIIVREEKTLSGDGNIVEIVADEGSRVSVGQVLANLYPDSDALSNREELNMLQQELEDLQAILDDEGTTSSATLEQQIFQSVLSLRSQTVSGDLTSVENSTQSLRALVFQQESSASSDSTSLSASLAQSIEDLESQISTLSSQSGSTDTSLTASVSGLFSSETDGLEDSLTPSSILSMTPSQLTRAANLDVSTDGLIGKIVTSDKWYYAVIVDGSAASLLPEGSQVTARFSPDFTEEVTMTVEQQSNEGQEENGQIVLILSSDRYLSQVLSLREQSAQLITESYEGIRIPQKALHMEEGTSADPETGTETTGYEAGVYTMAGAQARYNPVSVVASGSDYYLVTPATTDSDHILRVGDTVIVSASGLYDGKVISE
ncbi:MAG: hypothetical protein LUC17_04990 [Oscillospiraceae bacterium]|nr:hypothetical protein [Oscillospiraceae bacterium]